MIFTSTPATALVSRACVGLLLLISTLTKVEAAGLDVWRSQSIYQVIADRFALENGSTSVPCDTAAQLYCGGTFLGLINKLDYIQGMGFTALWLAPVVTNINETGSFGQAYHGYWSLDVTTINPHLGTPDELRMLSKALHDRGMLLMLDVVINNYAWPGIGSSTDYSVYTPFNSEEYFHPYCEITNYDNYTDAQECWLGNSIISLPDMNTENTEVQTFWQNWGAEMISNYSIDGFRIDAAKHVQHSFWTPFQNSVDAFTMAEALDTNVPYVCTWMSDALSGVLNYPTWYSIIAIVPNDTLSMSGLANQFDILTEDCQDTTLVGTFTENQDQPRFATLTNDTAQQLTALAFALLSDGIPIVYYGAEQALSGLQDPYNRQALWPTGYNTSHPLYMGIAAINTARNAITNLSNYDYWSPYWTYKSKNILVKDDVLVMRKGYDRSIMSVLTNRGSNADEIGPYVVGDTNFIQGDTIVDVLSCDTMTVGEYGVVNVKVKKGWPQAWTSASYLNGTDICPHVSKTTGPPTPSSGHTLIIPSLISILSLSLFIVTFL